MKIDVPYYKQSTKYSCGPTALRMLLAHFDVRASEEKLMEVLDCDARNGTDSGKFKTAIESFGLWCKEMRDTTCESVWALVDRQVPVLVNYRNLEDKRGHFAVIVGTDGEDLILNDPEYGENYRVHKDTFHDHWCSHDGDEFHWACVAGREPLSTD
jgi:ABC-type bacteriocin/lantibiotic exporter with double-glycine peptidase domain